MSTLCFEDIEEGDEITPMDMLLTKDRVRCYAAAANMNYPRFTDDEGARAEGFPGIMMPGVMSMGLFATMINRWNTAAEIIRIGTSFRSPVFPDCNIHLRGAVTQKNDDDQTADCDIWLENDDGDRWVMGTATVSVQTKSQLQAET